MGAIYAKNVYDRVTAGVETNQFTDVLTASEIKNNQIVDTYERTPVLRSPSAIEITRRLSKIFGTEIFLMAGGLALEPKVGQGVKAVRTTARNIKAEYEAISTMRVPDISARARMEILSSIIPERVRAVSEVSPKRKILDAQAAIEKLRDPEYVKDMGYKPAEITRKIDYQNQKIIDAGGEVGKVELPKTQAVKEAMAIKEPPRVLESADKLKLIIEKVEAPKIDKYTETVKKGQDILEAVTKKYEAEAKTGTETGHGSQKVILKTILEKPATKSITAPKTTKKPFLEEQYAKNKYRGETQYDVSAKKVTKGITKEEYVALLAERARLAEVSKSREIALAKAKMESVLKPVQTAKAKQKTVLISESIAKAKQKSILLSKSIAISQAESIQKVRSTLQPVQKTKQDTILIPRAISKPIPKTITKTTPITRTVPTPKPTTRTEQQPIPRQREKVFPIPRPVPRTTPETIQIITDILQPVPEPPTPTKEVIREPRPPTTKTPPRPPIIPRILFPIFKLPSGGGGGSTGAPRKRKKSWKIRNQIADLKSLFG
jgi:hypothetical protein